MNLKTNADGELIFTNGTFELVRNRESIAQNIRSNIRTWKGELVDRLFSESET